MVVIVEIEERKTRQKQLVEIEKRKTGRKLTRLLLTRLFENSSKTTRRN